MDKSSVSRIEKIEITNLWRKYDISWQLDPKVNILVGANGSGKSTILSLMKVSLAFEDYPLMPGVFDQTKVTFDGDRPLTFLLGGEAYQMMSKIMPEHVINDKSDPSKKYPPVIIGWGSLEDFHTDGTPPINEPVFTYISTFDMGLKDKAIIGKLSDERVRTELDFELYQLTNAYISYQLTLSRKAENLLFRDIQKNDLKARREEIYGKKNLFISTINQLFADTGKVLDSDEQERMIFRQGKTILPPYQLSAGEKQILIILLKTLLQNNQSAILLMDEPEISLHLAWQERLIDDILKLNEQAQIIIATHSPGIMMKGWLDKVTEMESITTKRA